MSTPLGSHLVEPSMTIVADIKSADYVAIACGYVDRLLPRVSDIRKIFGIELLCFVDKVSIYDDAIYSEELIVDAGSRKSAIVARLTHGRIGYAFEFAQKLMKLRHCNNFTMGAIEEIRMIDSSYGRMCLIVFDTNE